MVDLLTILKIVKCAGGSCLQEEVEATKTLFSYRNYGFCWHGAYSPKQPTLAIILYFCNIISNYWIKQEKESAEFNILNDVD